jgi:para-aminobenzoate synthetase
MQADGERGQLAVRRLEALPDPESAFVHLYGGSENAFWLDSGVGGERGRFSFMGDASGPLAGVFSGGRSVLDLLEWVGECGSEATGLPFDFDCGLVGYLGYELKAECGARASHAAGTPDAALILADRLIAFDHAERTTYLLALTHPPSERAARAWMDEVEGRLESLPGVEAPVLPSGSVAFSLGRSREGYREDIEACKRWLRAGDSYEICLTNRITAETDAEPLDLYRALRRANPAPFGAYLRFGELAVLSSSPERFLAVDRDRWAESRPIKGTARRSAEPAEDARLAAALAGGEKFRAENVTIVDLMRNDLGRVCEVGSVSVPELMGVESYETVHQLVSSVRGRLRHGLGAADAVRACFPPGSMTGAPKLRTMEIIDALEGEARGVYSGAIGWFGRSGACDLSVAIRTIVLDRGRATIGAGGAIVVDSDPDLEIEEMLLKAATAAAALDPEAAVSFAPAGAPGDLSGAAP